MKHIIPILIAMACAHISFAGADDRAMWIWEGDTRNALYNNSDRQALLDFSQSKGVTTLYLYGDSYLGVNDVTLHPGYYRSFISEAHQRGMQVHALLGSLHLKTWEYILPDKREDAVQMVRNVLDYNTGSNPSEKFDGFNVDIEPYILPAWGTNQPAYARYYLETLTAQKQLMGSYGQALQFGLCVPFWYDDQYNTQLVEWNSQIKPLYQHVQDMSEYISIMDYRNIASSVILNATAELQYADTIGRKVVIGIETAESAEGPWVSFYGYTEEEMETVLAAARAGVNGIPGLDSFSSFDGFAIHHYSSYDAMVVPEPAGLLLLGSGLAVIFTGRKKISGRDNP